MPHYVAFLRGMNLGGRRLTMDKLAALFTELKFTDVATFIASGNVIFKSNVTDEVALRKKIEKHLQASLGYHVETFLRSADEIAAIVTARPFSETEMKGEPTVHACFLHEALNAVEAKQIYALKTDQDDFKIIGRDFYWLCRVSVLDSKVGNLLLTKSAKIPMNTMRNMNTVRRLAAKYGF